MALKRAGSPIVFVAPPLDGVALGGSVIAETLGIARARCRAVDYAWFGRACAFVREAIARGMVLAARDVSDGGFLAALAEMALAARAVGAPIGLAIEEDDAIGAGLARGGLELQRGARLRARGRRRDRRARRAGAEHGVELGYGSIVTTAEPRFALHSERTGKVIATRHARRAAEAWEAPLRDFYGPPRMSGRHDARGSRCWSFPGTNSEDETLRALRAVGLDAELVHWSRPEALAGFAAFVLPGGFAHEDRIRAGAVAAHDALMDPVIDAAQAGKFVLGICNGAQILAEAGLVPGTGPLRRPTAAFAPNASGRFQSVHVHVKLAVAPERVPILAGIEPGALIPAWASHGDGRLVAPADELARIERDGHRAFVYADRAGKPVAAPNGAALDARRAGEPGRQRAGDHAAPRARRLDLPAPRRLARPGAACWRPRAVSASSSTSPAPSAAGPRAEART